MSELFYPQMPVGTTTDNSTTDNSTLMQLVGDHLWRLDYAGFQGTGTRRFKFLAGDSWSASNWGDKNGDGTCDQQNDNDISYAHIASNSMISHLSMQ